MLLTCKDETEATWSGINAEFSDSRKADTTTRIGFLYNSDGVSGSVSLLKTKADESLVEFNIHTTNCASRAVSPDCDNGVESILADVLSVSPNYDFITSVSEAATAAGTLLTNIQTAVTTLGSIDNTNWET